MDNTFHELVLKYMPWSYSKLDLARKCPFAFNRRYVQRVKAPYVETPEARIGKLIHEVLENCLKGMHVNDAYKKVCVARNELTHKEMEKCVSFRPGIINFLNKLKQFEENNKVVKKYVELDVAITTDFKPAEYWGKNPLPLIRGKVDYGFLNDISHLCIIDHKTGAVPTKQYSGQQMLTYEVITYYGLKEEIKGVKTMLNFVAADEILPFDGVGENDIITKKKFELIRFMNGCVADLESDDAKKGKHCDWCSYKSICPAQR